MIQIAYLTSGQVVIGECAAGDNEFTEPFEIFATPKSEPTPDSTVDVAMMPFGCMFGLLPALRRFVSTQYNTTECVTAPEEFATRYIGFRDMHLADMQRLQEAPYIAPSTEGIVQ